MLAARGGDARKLCNTSGRDYRALQLGEKLPTMSETAVLTLLAGNGNLIKRPFLIGPGAAPVGGLSPALKPGYPQRGRGA